MTLSLLKLKFSTIITNSYYNSHLQYTPKEFHMATIKSKHHLLDTRKQSLLCNFVWHILSLSEPLGCRGVCILLSIILLNLIFFLTEKQNMITAIKLNVKLFESFFFQLSRSIIISDAAVSIVLARDPPSRHFGRVFAYFGRVLAGRQPLKHPLLDGWFSETA